MLSRQYRELAFFTAFAILRFRAAKAAQDWQEVPG